MDKNKGKSILWMLREAKNHEIEYQEALDRIWYKYALDEQPSGIDYLALDCIAVYGGTVFHNWYGISRVLTPSVSEVVQHVIAFRRRRELLMMPRSRHELFTNRTSRVERRAKRLIEVCQ